MIPEIHISLVIEEESLDEELLNKLIELGATNYWHKGQLRGKSRASHENNGCSFKAKATTNYNVESVISDFWQSVNQDRKELLKAICLHNLSPIISVVVHVHDIMPSIYLEKSLLKSLAQVNIGLDIDIYIKENIQPKVDD
jgi:hypothetical protein